MRETGSGLSRSRALAGLAVLFMAFAAFMAACTGSPAAAVEMDDMSGVLVYDRDMLERSGVIYVENIGDQDISDIRASFVLKPRYDSLPVGSSLVASTGDGLAVISVGDVPAGDSLELDISGMVHAYIDLGAGYEISYDGGTASPDQ